MAGRCLNKVMLIGNLTRDPELRYTPAGTAVATFGLATNRRWKTQSGELKDEAQFHRIVVWNRLAELCAQLLTKGTRIYLEGRLQYREWTGNDNVKHQTTEIVAEDMIVLARGKAEEESLEKVEPEVDFEEIPPAETTVTPPKEEELKAEEVDDQETTPVSVDQGESKTDQEDKKEDKEEIPF